MMSSLAPEEGAPASPCAAVSKIVDAGNERTVAWPVRHMHRDVAELLQYAGTTPRRRRRKMRAAHSVAAEVRGRARYDCAFEEDVHGFAPPRLVWVKVRSHPWWPGQVFDPSDASDLALKEGWKRRRDAVLVACFGDKTFVWADAEDLLPLRDDFPRLAEFSGRSSNKNVFASAVNGALKEVARRVYAGLSCGCRASRIKKRVFRNSGVRSCALGAAVDAAFAVDAFRSEAFVGYVRALAVAPAAGADMLDLVVASAQLKAFTQWRKRRSVATPADDSMVRAARASLWRATTTRREGTRRGDRGADAPPGDMPMCARAAFMRNVFGRGETPEENGSAMSLTPPPAASERRDLAVSTMAQRNAFNQWMGAPSGIITECTATMDVPASGAMNTVTPPPVRRDTAKKTRPPGGDDADADRGNCRIVATSCISSREDSASEKDGDDGSETESEDFEVGSNWGLGWKDHVILMQFVAIFLLVCQLMQ